MIRLYRPRTDFNTIYRLILNELVPLSNNSQITDDVSKREISRRLKIGRTYVSFNPLAASPNGFVHAVLLQDRTLLIDMLAVHPDMRGRKLGIHLMSRAEAYGLSKRCAAARLYVDEGNRRAQYFYTRSGYRTAAYHADIRCFEMFKPLIPERLYQK